MGLRLDVVGEVLIGYEQDVFGVDRVYDLGRVGRCAACVGEGLNVGGAIDVGDHLQIGVKLEEFLLAFGERVCRDAIGERASGAHIGQQYHPLGIEDFGRLGHEVYAAEDNYFSVANLAGLAREFERIANKVSDLENFGALIVVRQENRTAFALELVDLGDGFGEMLAGLRRVAFFIKYGQLPMEFRSADCRLKVQVHRWMSSLVLPAQTNRVAKGTFSLRRFDTYFKNRLTIFAQDAQPEFSAGNSPRSHGGRTHTRAREA